PTIIWGWGGGTLRTYAEAGQVEDLTSWFDEHAEVKKGLFPSSFGAATVDGKIYAMPCETVQPIILYYNKKIFDQVGVEPPESWDDLMALVPRFNAKGIAPLSLGGQSRWTNMMWLEFLFDRIGGPEVFQAVIEGEKDAWSHPDAIT
ncbi:extracellular solute-binding protein, partial [Clavibacter michiganensis]